MKRKSSKQSKLERDNKDWRRDLVIEIARCQLPDCPGLWPHDLCVHEIGCGTAGRSLSFSRRLACLVVCSYCNGNVLTDYTIWPPVRQAALQCVLMAKVAEPAEILATLNFCRGRASTAIAWADVAQYLEVKSF